MDGSPEFLEISFQEQFPSRDAHEGVKGFDEFIEYPCEQGDSASGYSRNDIRRAHGESLERDDKVLYNVCHLLSNLSEIVLDGTPTLQLGDVFPCRVIDDEVEKVAVHLLASDLEASL